eukprot:scaffold502525_cov24-Prasinocladus_malaysianus.AAC.1
MNRHCNILLKLLKATPLGLCVILQDASNINGVSNIYQSLRLMHFTDRLSDEPTKQQSESADPNVQSVSIPKCCSQCTSNHGALNDK